MNVLDLEIGKRLEIELLNKDGEKRGPTYVSQLLQVKNESMITIASPIYSGMLVPISKETRLRIIYLHKTHGLLYFTGHVESYSKADNISILNVNVESPLKKIQRRQYYRLSCYLSADYCILNNENQDIDKTREKLEYKKAITRNLSASGLCLITNEKIDPKTYVHLILDVKDDISINAVCEVMRCSLLDNTSEKKYEVGMQFIKLPPKEQDLIIKFIFDQQRELLKKGIMGK